MLLVSLVALWTTFADVRMTPHVARTPQVAYRWGNVRRKRKKPVVRVRVSRPVRRDVEVAQPIRHGALRIEQQRLGNISEVAGGKGILLLAFEAVAGRQDVYLTTLKFRSAGGTLAAAENYRLLADINGDRRVDVPMGSSSAQGEVLTFANLNILVEDGRLHRMEIWGDLRSDAVGKSLALEFATSEPDVVEGVDRRDGEDVTGVELNTGDCTLQTICWVRLFTAPSRTITVTGTGSVEIER